MAPIRCLFPSSEVVPGRLALLLAARCDSSAHGEQYRTVEDERGLMWTPLDVKIRLRRVTDSNPYPVGSLGAGNPTDALFIPLATLSRKVYIFFEACLLRITVPLSPVIWAPPGALFYACNVKLFAPQKRFSGVNSSSESRWALPYPIPSIAPDSALQ